MDPIVELRGIRKAFGQQKAVDGIDLRVEAGSIHGIVGENGAGKSTAMNILFGLVQPDSGQILIRGRECQLASPSVAMRHGIGMVHQHFMLSPVHSVLDNIILGSEPETPGPVWWPRFLRPLSRRAARAKVTRIAAALGIELDPMTMVADLPVGLEQWTEILKLLYRDASIIILDEPTAVLTPNETEMLFRSLRHLRDEGKTILLITHKLKELKALTDRVSVFRQGQVVAVRDTAAVSLDELAALMIGQSIAVRAARRASGPKGRVLVEIKDLEVSREAHGGGFEAARLKGVSLHVAAGEVLGIAGVEGNGQSELIEVLRAPSRHPLARGTVNFCGADAGALDARAMRERGLAIVPEDRLVQGLVLEQSLVENFVLGREREASFCRGPWANVAARRAATRAALTEYDIRPSGNLDLSAAGLSGGNQQKLIVARECARKPHCLIAAQPTRGVDIGAVDFIHERLLSLRDAGLGVVLISSDLDEVRKLSDRILVIYEGRIVAEVDPDQASEETLGQLMGGSFPSSRLGSP